MTSVVSRRKSTLRRKEGPKSLKVIWFECNNYRWEDDGGERMFEIYTRWYEGMFASISWIRSTTF